MNLTQGGGQVDDGGDEDDNGEEVNFEDEDEDDDWEEGLADDAYELTDEESSWSSN